MNASKLIDQEEVIDIDEFIIGGVPWVVLPMLLVEPLPAQCAPAPVCGPSRRRWTEDEIKAFHDASYQEYVAKWRAVGVEVY